MGYDISFDEYFLYDDLTAHLHGIAEAYPNLASLESIGKSWQVRDVWCMTLTNPETGSSDSTPAFYIDGHIHAEEVTTSHTAMYSIWNLLDQYGTDADATWLLDNMTFYIIPRINPDGAEISLTTAHHWCGNGRYLPGDEQTSGLCQHDIDGDGLIVQMRIEDPNGEWRVSDDDPRLMVQRDPGEVSKGPYYRLYREGEIRGEWDGVTFDIQKPRDGNLNRNFPAGSPVVGHDVVAPELKFMVELGAKKDNYDALRCATIVAAHVSNLQDTLGTLEVGKEADMIVIDGDPLADLDALERVEMAFIAGKK